MVDLTQQEKEFHHGVVKPLNEFGENVTPEDLNPEHHPILYKIRKYVHDLTGEVAHIAGAPLDEIARGEASHIGFQEAKSWRQRLMERIKGKTPLQKAA